MPQYKFVASGEILRDEFSAGRRKAHAGGVCSPTNTTAVSISEFGFNEIKALIDAQQAQITALQAQLNLAAKNPNIGDFDPGFADPPKTQDLESIRAFINQMSAGMNW